MASNVTRCTQLRFRKVFNHLMDQLSGTENRIAVERIRYNECVQAYNTLRRQCRSDITADPFSLDANWVLFAAHEATETVPQVNFSPGT